MIVMAVFRTVSHEFARFAEWHGAEGPRPHYGEIKEALRTRAKPLTWLGSLRVRRSARVPLAQERRGNSSVFSALTCFKRPEDRTNERPR
jgi:hypothetical protein